MKEYTCITKCYYARPGAVKRLYSVDETYKAEDDEKVPRFFVPKGTPKQEAKLSEERKFRNMLEQLDAYALLAYAKKEYDVRLHPATGQKKLITKITALREEQKKERPE